MISVQEVLQIHSILIKNFGGVDGVRDVGGLESALSRPLQTFDSLELYPTVLEKAAAIIESILINHPFIDGNKRIGYVLMKIFLMRSGVEINATQNEKYELVIGIAEGKIKFEEIVGWLKGKAK